MKWIKFLKEYDGHKAGEIVSIDPTEAAVLIKAGQAEEAAEPKEVAEQATKLEGSLKEFVDGVTTQMEDAAEGIFENFTKRLSDAGKNAKSKRPLITVGADREDEDPSFGFKHVGEQIRAIKGWYSGEESSKSDERMKRIIAKAPTTFANEGTGADGGFLLAPNFSNQVLMLAFDDEALFSRTDTYTTGSNSLTIPKDETTPWGTNGVQVYWTAEAAQATQSKPKLGQDVMQLQKLTALVPVTDEQLQDSFVGLGQYVTKQAGQRIRWAVDDAIVNGSGAGKPLGLFNSGAIVSQAAEGGQTTGTINITNIAKMISRIPNVNLGNLVWLVHPSAFPQLVILTNGNQSMYIAAGAIANANPKLGTLFGIPVIISQHNPASLGTVGDILLVDLSKYVTLTKGDGIQTAMSIHLFFDYNVSTFRFNFRVAGQPWMQAPITSAYGSYSQSPFVSLASR